MKYFGIIYKATNLINKKVYIGQTRDYLCHRKYKHHYEAEHGSELYFHRAIRKYGKENFSWEIIAHGNNAEELDNLEKFYIAEFLSNDSSYGYNLTAGGLTSLPPNGRKVQCLETSKIYNSCREAAREQKIPENQIKLSCTTRIRATDTYHYTFLDNLYSLEEAIEGYFQGVSIDDIKRNMLKLTYDSVQQYGKITPRSKPVVCLETLVIFPSGTAAAKFLQITKDNVGAACRGIQETSGGLHWRYLTKEEISLWKKHHLICLTI